jgi:Spy/CpxP family protein refolding chaperone
MKLRLLPMFAGIIATGAMSINSLPAFSQTPAPAPAPAPQAQPRPRIVLSQEQQAKFDELKTKTVTQIEAVLTTPQKTQFATGRENGQGLGAIQNLSDTQKSKIIEILQAFNAQIGNILTPEQKRQIEQGR